MSNLSLVEATLPPGFRFHPRDEELVCDYLFSKLSLSDSHLLVEVDLNKCEPWDLPETACVGGKEWYFYSQRDRKYATGLRTNRATVSGYWKATGKDRSIFRNRTLVGMRKTLVFYLGRAPKGKKTDWVMHEFRLQGSLTPPVDSSIKVLQTACVGGKEWYFYSQRDRKYATGLRTNRATVSGYWKATGKDRSIFRNRTLVGMRKTLVFYLGRAPKGKKTDWVMHEFRLQGSLTPPVDSSIKEDWVLCRVFCKNNREQVDEKQNSNMGSISEHVGHEDTLSCLSSLPPLMDQPYTFSFDESQPTNNNMYNNQQQVPCFSNIFNIYSNPQFDLINNNNRHIFTTTGTTIPPPPSVAIPSSSSHCFEKKEVIKSILSRFNNNIDKHDDFKESTLSFGEGISDPSFLSDEALPVTMWYP